MCIQFLSPGDLASEVCLIEWEMGHETFGDDGINIVWEVFKNRFFEN